MYVYKYLIKTSLRIYLKYTSNAITHILQCAKKWNEICSQNLLITPSHNLSAKGAGDLDGIVDFLLQKRDSEESHDQVHVIEKNENNFNNEVANLNEQTLEQGK